MYYLVIGRYGFVGAMVMKYQSRVYLASEMRREIPKPKTKSHTNHVLLDYFIKECGAKTDTNIAARLNTTSSYISHIRNGKAAFGPKLILAAYDSFGVSIEKIRELLQT